MPPLNPKKFKMPDRPPVCKACCGCGRSSNNEECRPCEGTGVQGGKRKVKQRTVTEKPSAAAQEEE